MKISDKVCQLQDVIHNRILPLIDADYALFGLPYHNNIGDCLIWAGESQVLSGVGHRCVYSCSCDTFVYKPLSPDVIILLHGGGNLGDVWRKEQDFRLRVIQMYPDNRIIQLPQTVYYSNLKQAVRDAEVMARHPRLTLFARDDYSYRFLTRFGFSRDVLLAPDLAFALNHEDLQSMSLPEKGETLFVKRIDREMPDVNPDSVPSGAMIRDWPTVEADDSMVLSLYNQIRECSESGDFSETHRFAKEVFLPYMIRHGVAFVSPYTNVYTTRLHVALLSVILGKPVTIIDNSYGKNYRFFETWLKDTDGVECRNSNSTSVPSVWMLLYYRCCVMIDNLRIRFAIRERLKRFLCIVFAIQGFQTTDCIKFF